MVMMVHGNCKCCDKFARTGDFWHCEECWNNFHNGKRDNDWLDEKTFREMQKRC